MAVVCARECQAQQPNQAEQNEEKPKRHHIADGIESSTVDYKADGQRKQHHCQIDGDQAGDEGETPPGSRFSLAAPMSFLFRRKRGIGKSHRLELLFADADSAWTRMPVDAHWTRRYESLESSYLARRLARRIHRYSRLACISLPFSCIRQTIYHSPPQKLRGTYGGTIRYIQILLRYGLFASSTCI